MGKVDNGTWNTLCARFRCQNARWVANQIALIGFAIVLFVAGGLKLQQLLASNAIRKRKPIYALTIAEAGLELLISVWFLTGFQRTWARRAAICLLTAFLGVSGYHIIAGHHDCGCFGALPVRPASIALFDLSALVCIVFIPAAVCGRAEGFYSACARILAATFVSLLVMFAVTYGRSD